jgi:autotransporter-associated beta strand protein
MNARSPRLRSVLVAAALITSPSLWAANVIWDTSSAPGYQPGSGTWDVGSLRWTTNGTTLSAWVSGDSALFTEGTQGMTDAITLATNVTISGLTFGGGLVDSANWTIAGAGQFDLVSSAEFKVFGSSTATLSNSIGGNFGVNKTGSGILVFDAVNTYSGGTTISGGQLRLRHAQGAGTDPITINGGVLGLDQSLTIGNKVTLQSARSIIDMDLVAPNSSTLSGLISGAGTFVKTGRGTLVLAATNSYTGGTSIEGGVLKLSSDGAAGSGVITLNGGSLQVSTSFNVRNNIILAASTNEISMNEAFPRGYPMTALLSGIISGSGQFQKVGAGNFNISGANTYTGGTIINAGWLTLAHNTGAGTGAITVNGGALYLRDGLKVANAIVLAAPQSRLGAELGITATLSGVISGTGALHKEGDATLILTGANTFTGGLSVKAGNLLINGSVGGAAKVLSGASLGGSGVVGDVTVTAGGKISPGAALDSSVAALTLASLRLEGASIVNWNVVRADQAAGVGYDCMKVTGLLDLSGASSLNRVKLLLSGRLANFDPQQSANFKLLDYGTLNLGTNTNISDLFSIDDTGLMDGYGAWQQLFAFRVVDDAANHQLLLSYSGAVPEPSTYGFALGALGLAIAAVRRRRQAVSA